MRYIIIPLGIILYIWWSISAIKAIYKGKFLSDSTDYFVQLWVPFHLIALLVRVMIFIVNYW